MIKSPRLTPDFGRFLPGFKLRRHGGKAGDSDCPGGGLLLRRLRDGPRRLRPEARVRTLRQRPRTALRRREGYHVAFQVRGGLFIYFRLSDT